MPDPISRTSTPIAAPTMATPSAPPPPSAAQVRDDAVGELCAMQDHRPAAVAARRNDLATLERIHGRSGAAGVRVALEQNPSMARRLARMEPRQLEAQVGGVAGHAIREVMTDFVEGQVRNQIRRDANARIGERITQLRQTQASLRSAAEGGELSPEMAAQARTLADQLDTAIEGYRDLGTRFSGMAWEANDFPRSAERALSQLGFGESYCGGFGASSVHGGVDGLAFFAHKAHALSEIGHLIDAIGEVVHIGGVGGATIGGVAAAGVMAGVAIHHEVEHQRELAAALGRELGL